MNNGGIDKFKTKILNCLSSGKPEWLGISLFKALIHPSIQSCTKSIVQLISSSSKWNLITNTQKTDEVGNFYKQLLENFKELIEMINAKSGRWTNKTEVFFRQS